MTRLLYGSTLAVTIVSVPLLGFISAMVASERKKEIAIIRALGASKNYVVKMMLAESFALSISGGFIGIFAAIIILVGFQDFISSSLKIPFIIPSLVSILAGGGSALLFSIVVGGISSLWPAVRIIRSEPYETIRRGES